MCALGRTHRESRRWPTQSWTLPATSKQPTTSPDAYHAGRRTTADRLAAGRTDRRIGRDLNRRLGGASTLAAGDLDCGQVSRWRNRPPTCGERNHYVNNSASRPAPTASRTSSPTSVRSRTRSSRGAAHRDSTRRQRGLSSPSGAAELAALLDAEDVAGRRNPYHWLGSHLHVVARRH